jgi:hypothetical protein
MPDQVRHDGLSPSNCRVNNDFINFHSGITGNRRDIKMLQTPFTENTGTKHQALALLQYLPILADYSKMTRSGANID